MPETEKLQQVIAELLKVPADSVDASTVFTGALASSLGRARLDAMLRSRMGLSHPGVYTAKTFGELCHLVGADVAGVNPVALASSTNGFHKITTGLLGNGVAIGVDLQSVQALPDAVDYWEEEFYVQHYTRQEIAYALLQSNPRESFATMWCAKEALRKADARWLQVDWHRTEVAHESTGRPILRSAEETIPCSLSLSHADGYAIAVVAMAASTARSSPQSAPIPIQSDAAPALSLSKRSKLPLVLSCVALLISLLSLAGVLLK